MNPSPPPEERAGSDFPEDLPFPASLGIDLDRLEPCPLCQERVYSEEPVHLCDWPFFDEEDDASHDERCPGCGHLVGILPDNARLPDCIHATTMRATVRAWANEQSERYDEVWGGLHRAWGERWARATNELHNYGYQPPFLGRMLNGVARFIRHQKRPNRLVELRNPQTRGQLELLELMAGRWTDLWPFPYKGPVGLVIREWVQEEPNQNLAIRLQADSRWKQVLPLAEGIYDDYKYKKGKARRSMARGNLKEGVDDWIRALDADDWLNTRFTAAMDSELGQALQQRGLPATPGTTRYLRASVAGISGELPTRGLVVTTYAYVQFKDGEVVFSETTPELSVSGAQDLLTGPLLTMAQVAAIKHRNWLLDRRRQPLTDLSLVRRAQAQESAPAPKDDDYYSYVAQGTAKIDFLCQRLQNGSNRNSAISEYLDKVYRTVSKRRRDNGRSITPPACWRETVRAEIDLRSPPRHS